MSRSQTDTRGERQTSPLGCFLAAGVACLLLGLFVFSAYQARKQFQADREQEEQQRRKQVVAKVHAGDTDVTIWDARLLELLADDPVCREKLVSIGYFMADLSDPRYGRIRDFPNLAEVSFYDCRNVDNVITAAQHAPVLESLSFEVTGLSDQSIKTLCQFPSLKTVRFEQVMENAKIEELKRLLPDVDIDAPHLESNERELRGKMELEQSEPAQTGESP